LDRQLKELCRRSFIEPELGNASRERVYVFHHAITQEVAYQSLLQTTRREWHRLTGEAIETLSAGRLEEHSGILGRHFEQAGAREKAIRYFVQAADRARAIFSNLEAISFYRSALTQAEIGGTLPEGVGLELIASTRETLADVLALNGEFDVADEELKQAQSLIEPSNRIGHSRLYRKLASNWAMRREFEKTFACLDRAENELNLEGADRGEEWWHEWAQIQHERLHLFYWLGQCSELNALAATVQPHLEKHGTLIQRGRFFMMRALSLLSEHGYAPPEIAVEYAQRSVDLTKNYDNPTDLVHLWFVLGFLQLWRGNLPAAIAGLGHALQLSNQVGDLVLQLRCLTYLAVAHREMDDKSAARDYAERALSLATRLQMGQYTAMANATLAWVAWKGGDLVAVKALAVKALEEWHAMPDPYGFDWMALWPLIATAHAEKNFTEAIQRMRDLFGPNQHSLPAAVTTSAKKAIECPSESAEGINRAIGDALTAARSAHQL
jgi:tetratricopeptide (TPR) repeat protein